MALIQIKRQITERQKVLKEVEENIKRTEDLVYDLMNQTSPMSIYTLDQYNLLLKEDTSLRNLLAVNDPQADISIALRKVIKRRYIEINRRQDQAEELHHKLHLVKKEIIGLSKSIPSKENDRFPKNYVKDTLLQYSDEIKILKQFVINSRQNFIDELKNQKEKFKNDFLLMKQKEMENLEKKKEQLKKLAAEIVETKENKDELLKNSAEFPANPTFQAPIEVDQDVDDVRSKVSDYFISKQRVLTKFQVRIRKPIFDFTYINKINAAIDEFENRISVIIAKFKKATAIIMKNRKIENAKQMNIRMLQARVNFQALLRIGRLGMTVQKVANKIEPWFEAQYRKIKEQMKNERQNAGMKVEDTGMTVSQLRKEILRLEKLNQNNEKDGLPDLANQLSDPSDNAENL